MKAFTLNEVENVFEIGRIIQSLADRRYISCYESKDAFLDALVWAMVFEKEHADTEDYYWDLTVFVKEKLAEKGLI